MTSVIKYAPLMHSYCERRLIFFCPLYDRIIWNWNEYKTEHTHAQIERMMHLPRQATRLNEVIKSVNNLKKKYFAFHFGSFDCNEVNNSTDNHRPTNVADVFHPTFNIHSTP